MIETERLFIRPFTEEDREIVVDLLQDTEFMEHSDTGSFDRDGANVRFDQILSFAAAGLGKQAIVFKKTGEIVGYCGIEPFHLNGHEEKELGYRVLAKHRGKGIATEAALAVSKSHEGRLFAYVDLNNEKSARVLSRIGFSRHGNCRVHGKEYDLYEKNT